MSRVSEPTTEQLADFLSVDEDSFTDFAETALTQATLLFELATGLDSVTYPESGTKEFDLALNGILDMADALYRKLPYRAVLSNPFQSESIGSYSYSKAAKDIAQGLPTGIGWFDIAVQLLAIEGYSAGHMWSTSVAVFENDTDIELNEYGQREVVGPEDRDPAYGEATIISSN